MGFAYSFFSRSVAVSSEGEVQWRLNWISIDSRGASSVTRVLRRAAGALRSRPGGCLEPRVQVVVRLDLRDQADDVGAEPERHQFEPAVFSLPFAS